jgi:hypothetical protein
MTNLLDLVPAAHDIAYDLESYLHGDFTKKVKNACQVSGISVCGIRIRKTSPESEHFHFVTKCFGVDVEGGTYAQLPRLSFFSVTYEVENSGNTYDISLSFVLKDRAYVSFGIEECENCKNEEFCSQQDGEGGIENFSLLPQEIIDATYFYADRWSGYLAELAVSIGLVGFRQHIDFVVEQVYNTWDQLPEKLASSYSLYKLNAYTGDLRKDSQYCRKDECEETADSGFHCYSHEELCAVHDCFDDKEMGRYCYSHEK